MPRKNSIFQVEGLKIWEKVGWGTFLWVKNEHTGNLIFWKKIIGKLFIIFFNKKYLFLNFWDKKNEFWGQGIELGQNGPHQWIPSHFLGGVTCQCFFMGGLLLFLMCILCFMCNVTDGVEAADGRRTDSGGGLGGTFRVRRGSKSPLRPLAHLWSQPPRPRA